MNLRRIGVPGMLALVLAAGPVSAQGDAAAGEKKTAMCQGCHGIAGFRTAYPTVYSVPMLGGQSAAYLAAALKAYRSGDRANATMHAIAADLSDQDIEDLAAYYSDSAR